MSKRVAVVLSGCGFLDGAEITESVCTLLALSQAGAEVRCFAPDSEFAVVNHLTSEASGETRNILVEAARIARGEIRALSKAKVADYDAIILPGGFGAAKNLCSFAVDGPECSLDEHLSKLLADFYAAKKPIGAICIAPAVIARALGKHGPRLTIGNDAGTAKALEAMGAKHQECAVRDCVVDREHKIITTPAYMYHPSVADAFEGIRKCVDALVALA